MKPSQVESLSDDAIAWELLLVKPLQAAALAELAAVATSSQGNTTLPTTNPPAVVTTTLSGDTSLPTISSSNQSQARSMKEVTILIDSLDEGGSDGRMISFLVDIDNLLLNNDKISSERRINFIITTRPYQNLLTALRSHWKGDRFVEFTPSELRGEDRSGGVVLPLLTSLTNSIDGTTLESLDAAYGVIFNNINADQRSVLQVLLASYQPQSLSDLMSMGLLEKARELPRFGELFLERENKLHMLHRSIADWLLKPEHRAINCKQGHEQLAKHIWTTILKPWLYRSSSPPNAASTDSFREPPTGSYALKYALDHLREAGWEARSSQTRERKRTSARSVPVKAKERKRLWTSHLGKRA
jgi:hypothetical protein